MRKINILLSAAVALAMVSCGNSGADKAQTDSLPAETNETVAADPAAEADPVITLTASDTVVVAQELPVVIDFNATWCGPCKKFAPVFHAAAEQYASKAVFASADVDVCQQLASNYKFDGIPCVVIEFPALSSRKPVIQQGYMDEAQFKAFLDENL